MLWLSLSELFVCALRGCTALLSLGWEISALNSPAALALTETLPSNDFSSSACASSVRSPVTVLFAALSILNCPCAWDGLE